MVSATSPAYLPSPVYAALTTAESPYAIVNGLARRFQPDVIPFAGVARPTPEALRDLVPLLTAGEELYMTADAGETIQPVEGLTILSTFSGLQMRFCGTPLPENCDEPAVVALTHDDLPEMLDLKQRAFPGYFGPRAPELGSFFGIRDGASGRLIAMGGERLATHNEREISAVCTDPEHTGHGYAARIVRAVLRHQARLGVGSLLHVTAANTRAISLYQHLGFCTSGPLDFVKVQRV